MGGLGGCWVKVSSFGWGGQVVRQSLIIWDGHPDGEATFCHPGWPSEQQFAIQMVNWIANWMANYIPPSTDGEMHKPP